MLVSLLVLRFKFSPIRPMGTHSRRVLLSFLTIFSSFIKYFLALWHKTRYFRFILYFPCPSHGISHFSEECWFLLMEIIFRRHDLGSRCIHCYQSGTVRVPLWLSTDPLRGHRCTQAYIFVLYFLIFICWKT